MIFVELSNCNQYLEIAFKPVRIHLDRIKSILGSKFSSSNKKWTIPVECIDELEEQFSGEIIWITPTHVIKNEPPPQPPDFWKFIPNNNVSNFKIPLYDFQLFGANFLAYVAEQKGFAFLGDMMGTGKTAQAIAASELLRQNKLLSKTLIVCLSPLKIQWQKEGINKFTNKSSIIINGTPAQRKKKYAQISNYDYVIISYELVLKDIDLLLQMQKNNQFNFDLLILDEAHKVKNHQGKTNSALSKLTFPYKIFLSGTPIMNKPDELFGLFKIADKNVFGKFSAFSKKYLNYQYNGYFQDLIGYRNLDELREVFSTYFLRRTDKEVEMDLPDIVEINDYVEATDFQRNLDKSLLDSQQNQIQKLSTMKKNRVNPEAIKEVEGSIQGFMNLRIGLYDSPELFTLSHSESVLENYGQIVLNTKGATKSPKLQRLIEIVQELTDNGHKVIVFSQFKRMVDIIHRELESNLSIDCLSYYGGLSDKERDQIITDFKTNNNYKVFIATEAGSTGLNLQVAKYLINYDLPWTPAIWEQRKGRIRRIGSSHSTVKIINLLVSDSIDTLMYEVLEKKQNLFNAIVENNEGQTNHLKQV